MKVYIFIDKIFKAAFLEVTGPLRIEAVSLQSEAIAKLRQ